MSRFSSSHCASHRFRWQRSGTVALRPAVGPEWKLLDSGDLGRCVLEEGRLAPAHHLRVITLDSEIAAGFALGRGRWKPARLLDDESPSARQVLAAVEPDCGGDWALKTGLWLAARHRRRLHGARRHLLRLAGPVGAANFAARHGLCGYVSAVILHRWSDFAPAVSPRAYVQQSEAGSIDDPLLVAHLRYGARPVAIVDTIVPPVAVLRWRRG